jgi:hypothetical protein
MMRLRRASAIAVLCVLASATMADAECAWVLWSESTSPDPRGTGWRIINTSPDENRCRLALTQHVEVQRQAWTGSNSEFRAATTGGGFTVIMRDEKSTPRTMIFDLYCFPDTVDPRGQRGK